MLKASSARRLLAFSVVILTSAVAMAQANDPRIERARAKGDVSLYTSMLPAELRDEVAKGFKERTGLSLNIYYGGTGQLFSRLTTERKTSAYNVDVIMMGDLQLTRDLLQAGALRPYKFSPARSKLGNETSDPAGAWHTFAIWGVVLSYNNQQVKTADAPKSWEEMADPKWKGKVAIADPARSATGFQMLKIMAHDAGWDWIEKLLRNDPLILAISPQIDQTLATGERLIGTTPSMNTSDMMKSGAPLAVADVGFLFLGPNTVSLVDKGPNPDGGELFIDYLSSDEVAKMLTKYGYFPTNPSGGAPYGYPKLDEIKYRYAESPTQMTRQEYIDKYNAILQSIRK